MGLKIVSSFLTTVSLPLFCKLEYNHFLLQVYSQIMYNRIPSLYHLPNSTYLVKKILAIFASDVC